MSLLIAAAALYSRGAATVPADTAEPAMNAETTSDPEEQARQEALAAKRADALSRAQTLAQQNFYDEVLSGKRPYVSNLIRTAEKKPSANELFRD